MDQIENFRRLFVAQTLFLIGGSYTERITIWWTDSKDQTARMAAQDAEAYLAGTGVYRAMGRMKFRRSVRPRGAQFLGVLNVFELATPELEQGAELFCATYGPLDLDPDRVVRTLADRAGARASTLPSP